SWASRLPRRASDRIHPTRVGRGRPPPGVIEGPPARHPPAAAGLHFVPAPRISGSEFPGGYPDQELRAVSQVGALAEEALGERRADRRREWPCAVERELAAELPLAVLVDRTDQRGLDRIPVRQLALDRLARHDPGGLGVEQLESVARQEPAEVRLDVAQLA